MKTNLISTKKDIERVLCREYASTRVHVAGLRFSLESDPVDPPPKKKNSYCNLLVFRVHILVCLDIGDTQHGWLPIS